MSKKEQAQKIYNDNVSTRTRPEIIKMFMEELDMSTAGASTYYANCRSATNVNQPTDKVTKRVKAISQALQTVLDNTDNKTDNRQLYSVCTVINNVVQDDTIGSFFDEQLARTNALSHQTIVLGNVDIGENLSGRGHNCNIS